MNSKNRVSDNDEIRQLIVLVEKMDDKISTVAEGHAILERKIDEIAVDVSVLKADVSELKSDVSILKIGRF